MGRGVLEATEAGYTLHVENGQRVAMWLRSLSDGFALIDHTDPYAKAPGPVDVRIVDTANVSPSNDGVYAQKAYFIGANGENYAGPTGDSLPEFVWTETEGDDLKYTPLHGLHKALGAKMAPFAGYEMPLWYSSVSEEHLAVRKSAGVFDVTHMGVFDAKGAGAAAFLDKVTTNDVFGLAVGESHYTYLLDVHGIPFDDLMIYHIGADHYLIVVNASNNDKNWAWLNAVINGEVMIDSAHPDRRIEGADRFVLRDLRDRSSGGDRRVDIALQGPNSKNVLLEMAASDADRAKINGLKWANVTQATVGEYNLIISRTGYTGERIAYELFVHPDQAEALVRDLLGAGVTFIGLAARDSLRTEAGLPLYGHELGGDMALNPADAGYSNFVKLSKPFFVGKAAFVAHEQKRDAEIVRFRLNTKGARPPHPGDPIVDGRGRVVGVVTSCSIDSEGYQLGQAYVKDGANDEGTAIAVFCGSSRTKLDKSFGELTLGDRVPMPEPATVLSRFPKKSG
jgi:glycine hydroxymethyltransferase